MAVKDVWVNVNYLIQLTQSVWASLMLCTTSRRKGSKMRIFFFSQAAAKIFPSELNSRLKIPPGALTGTSSLTNLLFPSFVLVYLVTL